MATIIQQGYLKVHAQNGTWKRRWFALTDTGCLSYMNKRRQPRGAIILSPDFFVANSSFHKKRQCFQLSDMSTVVLYLQADSLKARVAWMVKLAEVISALGRLQTAATSRNKWSRVRLKLKSVLEMEVEIEQIVARLSRREAEEDSREMSEPPPEPPQAPSAPPRSRRLSVKSQPFWEIKARKK